MTKDNLQLLNKQLIYDKQVTHSAVCVQCILLLLFLWLPSVEEVGSGVVMGID